VRREATLGARRARPKDASERPPPAAPSVRGRVSMARVPDSHGRHRRRRRTECLARSLRGQLLLLATGLRGVAAMAASLPPSLSHYCVATARLQLSLLSLVDSTKPLTVGLQVPICPNCSWLGGSLSLSLPTALACSFPDLLRPNGREGHRPRYLTAVCHTPITRNVKYELLQCFRPRKPVPLLQWILYCSFKYSLESQDNEIIYIIRKVHIASFLSEYRPTGCTNKNSLEKILDLSQTFRLCVLAYARHNLQIF